MAKKQAIKKVAGIAEHDMTVTGAPLVTNGETFHLVFTFGALSIAQKKLNEAGVEVDLLRGLDFRKIDAATMPSFLFAAMHSQHPEYTPQMAADLITMENYVEVFSALSLAYKASLTPKDAKPNPPKVDQK